MVSVLQNKSDCVLLRSESERNKLCLEETEHLSISRFSLNSKLVSTTFMIRIYLIIIIFLFKIY